MMNKSNINEDKAKCYFREILNGLKCNIILYI